MKSKNNRKMWSFPWGYLESIIIIIGFILVGFILQFLIGNFNFYLLTAPVNIYFGILIIALCAISLLFKNSNFIKWFTGIPISVTLIIALLVLTLIMGLTPQYINETNNNSTNIFSKLGFNQMTHSWSFVLIYLITLLSLGCLIFKRLYNFKLKHYAFYLNHIGLWLVLFAAGLGYADIERYIMHVRKGETEWRVYDSNENVKELPIAIQLNNFEMEEYPPKLTVINRQTGIPQPEESPDFYQIDHKITEGQLNGWKIKLEQYIHQAVRNSDSTYREVPMPGATPAAFVQATNVVTNETLSGWVCGGNQAQLYMTFPLDEHLCIVMTVSEPKQFTSDINVFTMDGLSKNALLKVNKPLRIGNWTLYQYGYDNQAGRLSSYSSIELVYDPWVTPVYIGFIFIALGALIMLWKGKPLNRKYYKS